MHEELLRELEKLTDEEKGFWRATQKSKRRITVWMQTDDLPLIKIKSLSGEI